MPHLYIIAGCNGAGKTTGSLTVLPEMLDCLEFVNADLIAYGLSPLNTKSVELEAGKLMLKRMNELLAQKADFAFETTLATKSYVSFISRAHSLGYQVILLFFWLESPQMAIQRVTSRVAAGGHHIDDEVVERRYYRGIKNLHELYMPVCDDWLIVDNTLSPVVIADRRNNLRRIANETIWDMIKQQIPLAREEGELYLSDLHARIEKGLQKAYRALVINSALKNESLVVKLDGRVQLVPARELMHTISDPPALQGLSDAANTA